MAAEDYVNEYSAEDADELIDEEHEDEGGGLDEDEDEIFDDEDL